MSLTSNPSNFSRSCLVEWLTPISLWSLLYSSAFSRISAALAFKDNSYTFSWTTCSSMRICPSILPRPFLSLSWKSLYATSILSTGSSFTTVAFFLLSITGYRMSLNPSTCWQSGILDRTYSATFVSPQLPSAMRIAASHITVSMSKMLL